MPRLRSSLRLARQAGEVLADYADFLAAQANHEAGNEAAAEALLHGFAERYPDSIFDAQAPELEATVLLAMNDAAGAQRVLAAAADGPAAERPGYQLARGAGRAGAGADSRRRCDFQADLLDHPLSPEAETARARLTAEGAEASLDSGGIAEPGRCLLQRRTATRKPASSIMRWRGRTGLDEQSREWLCGGCGGMRSETEAADPGPGQALPDTQDDNGARRLYLLMELARNRNDQAEQQSIVAEMETRFPQSEWLAEALFSSGNMYLLSRDYPKAVEYYSYLAAHFPQGKNAAAAHWRAGWLSYRQGLYADAARLFDEQIRLYPDATETAAALYWRARLYETQDHKPALAAANYRAIVRAYQHYFYAQMARERLAALGNTQPVAEPRIWTASRRRRCLRLTTAFPMTATHLAKAKLLANAGLNDYIPAGDCSGPGLGFVERAGRGADLRFRWRHVSRDARAEAGIALRCDGFHRRHSAGRTGAFFFRSRIGRPSRPSRRRTIWIPTSWLR